MSTIEWRWTSGDGSQLGFDQFGHYWWRKNSDCVRLECTRLAAIEWKRRNNVS